MDSEKLDVLCDALRIKSRDVIAMATFAVNGDIEAKKVNNIACAMNAIRELNGTKGQILEEIAISEEELREIFECVSRDFEHLSNSLRVNIGNAKVLGKESAISCINEMLEIIERFGKCRKDLETLRERLNLEEEENDNQ